MKEKLLRGNLAVRSSHIHGYGVFAAQDFQPGDIIEECHTLLTNQPSHIFTNYFYHCTDNLKYGIALGYGSIFNHSDEANADYNFDVENSLLVFKANRFIQCGEEIFCNYGKGWFEYRCIKFKRPLSQKFKYFLKKSAWIFRFLLVAGGVAGACFWIQKVAH